MTKNHLGTCAALFMRQGHRSLQLFCPHSIKSHNSAHNSLSHVSNADVNTLSDMVTWPVKIKGQMYREAVWIYTYVHTALL